VTEKDDMTMFRETRNQHRHGAVALVSPGAALAAGGAGYVEDYSFSFEGPFGRFDQNQLQRGLQVYTEVCAACHGLRYVALRTLSDPQGGPGLTDEEVRAYIDQNFIEVYDEDRSRTGGWPRRMITSPNPRWKTRPI
jgi:cytochrome c1